MSAKLLCGKHLYAASVGILWCLGQIYAQPEIQYDPEKGIMILDKNKEADRPATARPLVKKRTESRNAVVTDQLPHIQTREPVDSTDIHIGRKKDPPELYFNSGLEYFKNRDSRNALQNFKYADSMDPKPQYRLWVGKTLRQLNEPEKMLACMRDILRTDPECDVADDALFEIAVYYQNIDDYETAGRYYTRISEQYPFGTSFSNGGKYIDLVRDQRNYMRAELSNMLAILGYTAEDIATNIRTFQRVQKQKVTGKADQSTVRRVKEQYQKLLDRERQMINDSKLAEKYFIFTLIIGILGLINISMTIVLLTRIKERRVLVDELHRNIAALDFNAEKA